MFKFMHDEGINGIDVYKATDANLSNWQRLNYDAENNIMLNPTDCNN